MAFSIHDYLNELRSLVNVDCGTLSIEGIEIIVDIMEEKYIDLGWDVKRVPCGVAGTALEIRNKPETDSIDIMIIGHMDTVFPVGTVAERPMHNDDERAYGPGVADMKAGLLNVVYALRGLDKSVLDALSICVCMNPDEETGSMYSEEWLKSVAVKAKKVLVAEPGRPDYSLIKARKGMARYRVSFHGKAAHAGNDLQNGRSAIVEMANWILFLNNMTNFTTGTTFNIGLVKGGSGANVVADFAEIIVDVRLWDNEDYKKADVKIYDLAKTPFVDGVTITIEREVIKPSMTPSKETEVYMTLVEEAGKELNMPITWESVGGLSDANLTASLGIPSLDGFGPSGAALHSANEYLDLKTVEPRIKLLQQVLIKIAS